VRISIPVLQLLGKILLPNKTSNCVFGGAHRDRLFITASTDVYAVQLRVRGANVFA
jgi:gluconolactonase